MRRRMTLALLVGACAAALAMAAGAPPMRLALPKHPPADRSSDEVPPPPGMVVGQMPMRKPPEERVPLAPPIEIAPPDSTQQVEATPSAIAVTVTVSPALIVTPGGRVTQFALDQNQPNPVANSTMLQFRLPVATSVRIDVFSVTGQRMAVPVDGQYPAGIISVPWNGAGVTGRRLPAGVYAMRMTAGSFVATRKLLITP